MQAPLSELVLVAIIGAGQAVTLGVLAIIGPVIVKRLSAIRAHAASAAADAREARDQVANDHTTNLREESDERHTENTTTLREVLRLQRSAARTNARRFRSLEARMTALETHVTNPN